VMTEISAYDIFIITGIKRYNSNNSHETI